MRCPHCQKWEITEFDVFCGWCRTKLVDFTVSFNRSHLCVNDIVDGLELTLAHAGSVGTIRVEQVASESPWLVPHAERVADLSIQVGKDVVIPLEADLHSLSDDYHEGRVVITSSVGERAATLEVSPRPKFQITTGGEHTVLLDNLQDEAMSGYLAVTRGIVTVESLAADVPWVKTVRPSPPVALPLRLDQRTDNRLEFVFELDEPYLLAEVTRGARALPAEYKGTLLVKLAEFEETRKETFRVKCFLPPLLHIPEAEGRIRLEVFAGKRGEIDLTLQNGERDEPGRANLQIQEIKIDAPWLQLSGAVSYPLNVASGQYHGLTLAASTVALSEGVHAARVTFVVTNTPGELRERHVPVDVDVRRMPEFEGTLAIDFGTTNSCCAFLDGQTPLTLIPIGERGDGGRTTVSSAILYQDHFDGDEKQYIVGDEAYALSFLPENTFSAIRQVKRRLGTDKPYDIVFTLDPVKRATYRPREVASDIIRRILGRAEERVRGRVTSCTVSHPSRFSLRQLEDLKEAVAACGIDKARITTVHEPVGAAVDFIQQKEVRERYTHYHLMVFDFGGGTTDITLLSVRNERLGDLMAVTPNVLGATGDRWFGGEDVTDVVMSNAVSRCEMLLRARNPDAHNVVVPFNAENFTDPRRKRLAQTNRNFLRRWAEATKIAIATYGDEHQEELRRNEYIDGKRVKPLLPEFFTLAVIVDNDVRTTEQFFHEEVVPRQEEIDEQLRPRLEQIMEMMRRLARNNDIEVPDIILLSGKSSALPIVRSVMEAHFPESRIEQPPDLKECVVRGACQLTDTEVRAGVDVRRPADGAVSATTSRLGLRVTDTGQAMFHEVVDAGVPIGEEGLRSPVKGIRLRRDSRIRIMENTSLDERIVVDGQPNRNITELKVFRLDARLADWEQRHGRRITDQDLFAAEVELVVTPNLLVRLVARVPGVDETLEFEAEAGGW